MKLTLFPLPLIDLGKGEPLAGETVGFHWGIDCATGYVVSPSEKGGATPLAQRGHGSSPLGGH